MRLCIAGPNLQVIIKDLLPVGSSLHQACTFRRSEGKTRVNLSLSSNTAYGMTTAGSSPAGRRNN
jgi:hypothetical protein